MDSRRQRIHLLGLFWGLACCLYGNVCVQEGCVNRSKGLLLHQNEWIWLITAPGVWWALTKRNAIQRLQKWPNLFFRKQSRWWREKPNFKGMVWELNKPNFPYFLKCSPLHETWAVSRSYLCTSIGYQANTGLIYSYLYSYTTHRYHCLVYTESSRFIFGWK